MMTIQDAMIKKLKISEDIIKLAKESIK
jgi:hypothetical protein